MTICLQGLREYQLAARFIIESFDYFLPLFTTETTDFFGKQHLSLIFLISKFTGGMISKI